MVTLQLLLKFLLKAVETNLMYLLKSTLSFKSINLQNYWTEVHEFYIIIKGIERPFKWCIIRPPFPFKILGVVPPPPRGLHVLTWFFANFVSPSKTNSTGLSVFPKKNWAASKCLCFVFDAPPCIIKPLLTPNNFIIVSYLLITNYKKLTLR